MSGNREYKSDVFSMLLEEPENALEIYNGLNNSNYKDAGMVKIMTLESGFSLTIRNDASFIIGSEINFYEHQASYNPNMALRHLVYFSRTIEKDLKGKNIFANRKITIPTPHFVVFYNGTEVRPEVEIQRLSEHFEKKTDEPEIDLVCTVYNICKGNNSRLLEKCPVLSEYMYFVERVRYRVNCEEELEQAIGNAIDDCISEGILADFLRRRRDEVTKSIMIDMRHETILEIEKRVARDEGREEGIKEGSLNMLFLLLGDKIISLDEALKRSGLSEEVFNSKLSEYLKSKKA